MENKLDVIKAIRNLSNCKLGLRESLRIMNDYEDGKASPENKILVEQAQKEVLAKDKQQINFTFKYKLIVVRQDGLSEHKEYSIGTFLDEESLKRWAEQNQGELAKSYPENAEY